jgi:hypothetical protein
MPQVSTKRGDIFLTQGDSFVSKAIRFFTRSTGESRTMVNHVGVVTSAGPVEDAKVVEALSKVKRRKLSKYKGGKTKVAVFRPVGLDDNEISNIVVYANKQVGKDYGYVKIVAHLLDWCLGGVYVFRKMARMEKYPICSWLVAYAYDEVGQDFGVEPWAADPDHIWDYVTQSPLYTQVHPLVRL